MINLKELNKLEKYCKDKGLIYKRIDQYPTYEHPDEREFHQIIIYKSKYDKEIDKRKWDAVCHYCSYGGLDGLLEIMGDIVRNGDCYEGWLTAEDIISRI